MSNGFDPRRSFWSRFDNPDASQENAPFAAALTRWLDTEYPIPGATSPVRGLPDWLQGVVRSQIGPTTTPGVGGALTTYAAPALIANELISSLLGIDSPLQQAMPEGQLDITNPAVSPSEGEEFSPLERFIRDIRIVGRATGAGLFRGAGVAVGTGLGAAYAEGELAEPKNPREAMLHTVGAILAGSVPFLFTGGAGAVGNVIRGGRVMPGALGGGARAAQPLGMALAEDAVLGATFGVAEAASQNQLLEAQGRGDEALDVQAEAAKYAMFGLGLGALFRVPTHANAIKLYGRMWDRARHGPLTLDVAPGIVHNGIRTEVVNGKIKFRNIENSRWVSPDDVGPENIQVFRQLSANKARQVAEGTPEGQLAEQAVAQASPDNPQTLPPDLATPDNLAKMNLYGGMYYGRAQGLVIRLGREKAARQLDELRKIMLSDEPEHLRLSVGGRVLALERALGEAQRLPGQLPVELEAAAIQTVARALPRGREEVLRIATDAALEGRLAFSQRIRALLETDLPQTYAAEIQRRLARANTARNRGFKEGTQGIYQGRPVQLMQRPNLGLALAKRLDDASAGPVMVSADELLPMPKAGQHAVLKDRRIAYVKVVNPTEGKFLAEIQGQEAAEWVTIDQIDELASSTSGFKNVEARRRALLEDIADGTVEEVPATPAVTVEGEPVTITGIGEEGVTVRTKSGRAKTVKKEQVRPTQVEPGSREITTFTPGKIPAQGNRILFIRVRDEGAGALNENFKDAWQRGKRVAPYVIDSRRSSGNKTVFQAHVLPQPASGEDALYAIELPASMLPKKAYSVSANEAVNALGGKGTIATHASWIDIPEEVFNTAQIYEVPEALRGATVRPDVWLKKMSPEEQTSYLRNLLVANENIPSEVAQPIAESKVARQQLAEALTQNDGETALQAEASVISANVKAAEAVEDVRIQEGQRETNKIVDEVRELDPELPEREALELEGYNQNTAAYYSRKLEELPMAMQGDPRKDSMVAFSLNVDGQRAIISRYGRPHFVEGKRGATPEVYPYYVVEIVDPEGMTIRGATREFDLPLDVARYLENEGYRAGLYHTYAGEFYHPLNRGLTVAVKPIKGGPQAEVSMLESQARETSARRAKVEAPELTPEAESLLLELREGYEETTSTAPQWKVVASKKVKNVAEVNEWAAQKGFVRRAPSPDLTTEFKKLPAISTLTEMAERGVVLPGKAKIVRKAPKMTPEQAAAHKVEADRLQAQVNAKEITPEQGALQLLDWRKRNLDYERTEISAPIAADVKDYLEGLEEEVVKLLRRFVQQESTVPFAVQTYAHDFARIFYKHVGRAPFSREMRTKYLGDLGIPHVEDFGPSEAPSVLQTLAFDADGERMANTGMSIQEGIIPEDIRTGIKIGKDLTQAGKAAQKLAELVSGRSAPGLTQTQRELANELTQLAKVLSESKDMQEIGRAMERLHRLRRTVVAFEKLRLGIKPTTRAPAGVLSEEDAVRKAERALRRRGAKISDTQVEAPESFEDVAEGAASKERKAGLSEMDLLPANEEVMKALARLGAAPDAIREGPHGASFRGVLPHDFETGGHVFYPHVLGISTKAKSDLMRDAERIVNARKQQTIWSEAASKVERIIPEPGQFSARTDLNLARYRPTNQLVEITDGPAEILAGDEVRVRFLDGQEMTVAKSELKLQPKGKTVDPSGFSSRDAMDYRLAEYVLDGRYAAMFKREPPLGFGPVEKRLGVFGTNDRSVVAGAIYSEAERLAQSIDPNDATAPKEVWDKLFDMHRRAQWLDEVVESRAAPKLSTKTYVESLTEQYEPRTLLGQETEEFTPVLGVRKPTGKKPEFVDVDLVDVPGVAQLSSARRGKPVVVESASKAVLSALYAVNPKLLKPFRQASYIRMRDALGPDAFSELQAQAFAGFLGERQISVLREFAIENGIAANTPLSRIVVELRERQLLDPHSAMIAVSARKATFLRRWAEEVAGGKAMLSGIPLGGLGGKPGLPEVIIKPVASLHDLKFGGFVGSTWRVAQRHPHTRHVMDMLYRAQELEKKAIIKREREFKLGLEQMGIKFEDRNAIRRMTLEAHENGWNMWDDIAANSTVLKGLKPEKRALYQRGFFTYRRFYAERLRDLKRHFLRRGVKPIIYDPNDQTHQAFALMLAKEYGVPMESLQEGTALLPFQPELIYRNGQFAGFGMVPRGYNEDEISFFLRMMEEYGSEAELPLTSPPGIRQEMYDEFKEGFDFWQRYGQVNYWPLVHEGSIAAINQGTNKIMAWGQTIPDVLESLRTMMKDGRLTAADRVEIKQVSAVADDITINATKTARQFREIAQFYAEQTHMDPDEVMAIITKAQRPVMEMRKPGQVHGKPRKAGLEPVHIDADQELALYNARVARMDYRWDVLNAWRAFTDVHLDRALSEAYKVPRMHDSMPGLKDYMQDAFSTALGERRSAEKVADVFWSVLNMSREAPKEFGAVLRGELDIMTVLNPSTYYRKYAARSRASDLLGLQTLIKLGGSMGSAFANWTQFFVTTLPKLITEGEDASHIARLVWNSQKDAFKIWRARYPLFGQPGEVSAELRVLTEMLDEAGIDLLPAKTQAGGRSVGDVLGGPPIPGGSKAKFAYDWAQYKLLYAFNGAEKMNRFSTSIAAIRKYADRAGKSIDKLTSAERAEAIESARRLVRETQFLYDELSLPRMLRSGPLAGPIGRILFQFKPFMLNMMEYEMGLLKNAFFNSETRFGKVALAQLGAHFGAMSVLGGAVGLLYNPMISIPYQLINWITGGDAIDPATKVTAAQRERRRQMASAEENFQQSWHFKADDVLYYGLPALVGLDLGQRVGVSGQDLTMTLSAPGILGPHASAYWDMYQAWKKYAGSRGHGRAAAGAAAGALATGFLPSALQRNIPWLTTLGATTGAALASRGTPNDFGEYLQTSPEGKKALSRMGAVAFRNARRSFDLFFTGAMRDMDGKPMYVPAEDRWEEAAWLAMGLPTANRQEYTAALTMLSGQAAEISNTRQILTARAAQAWADGDYGQFYEIMYRAAELDVELDGNAIERELRSLSEERMSTVFQRLPIPARIK